MAQARKKTATRTKKSGARGGQAQKKASTRTAKKQRGVTQKEKMHLYAIMAMGIVAGILLCANAAMMVV